MRIPTYEEAKSQQQELRWIEKLDDCVVQVVFAETEEAALTEQRRIYRYSEINYVRNIGKHA